MSALGNILWIVFGGFILGFVYLIGSLLLFLTIVGIPFGLQTLKLASFAFLPFGREIRQGERMSGCLYIIMNVLWILVVGIELTIMHIFFALFFAITIIGIPFAKKHIELAMLALVPFGHDIVDAN